MGQHRSEFHQGRSQIRGNSAQRGPILSLTFDEIPIETTPRFINVVHFELEFRVGFTTGDIVVELRGQIREIRSVFQAIRCEGLTILFDPSFH